MGVTSSVKITNFSYRGIQCYDVSMKRTRLVVGGVVLFIVIAAGVATGLLIFNPKSTENPVDDEIVVETPPPDPVATGGEMRILLAGNIFWGRRTNTNARASELGVAYPFSGLHELGRDDYDSWIAGLECPVTGNGHNKYEEETLLKFNCDPDYLPEAAKWFNVVSLGNNHTDNQGDEGFTETKTHLEEAGIQYFGHYDYRDTKEVCAPIALPLRVSYDDGTTREGKTLMAFCGFHGVFGVPTEASLQEIKRWAEVMPVIAMPHMGTEYQASSNTLRENLYRKMIDYGAAMVIGDHPHWVQNTEAYKGKLIVYSTGNFMFDQTFSAEVKRGAGIDATLSFGGDYDFDGWETAADKCLDNKAGCLDYLLGAQLEQPVSNWVYDYHAVENNGKDVTVLGDATLQEAVGARLNWAKTVTALGQ